MTTRIRAVTMEDAAAVARLAGELSYPCDTAAMERRLERALASDDEEVFVAEADGVVIGWMHVGITESLESGPYAEIRGLIVAERVRSRGIGALFVATAMDWARERSLPKVRVRTNTTRERTHAFYEREGFSLEKSQRVYDRSVEQRSSED